MRLRKGSCIVLRFMDNSIDFEHNSIVILHVILNIFFLKKQNDIHSFKLI
jgi:hypothetical protein